jgi:hypothetical protein
MALCRVFVALTATLASTTLCYPASARPHTAVITNVTVIDTTGGPSKPGMDVLIRDGRIASIQPTGARWGAAALNGSGKFLIPGLWDMSVHLSWATKSALPLLVANGITDVRDLGGDLVQIDGWRTRIDTGLLTGPHILRVGPMLNGKSFNQYQLVAGPPEQARGVVRTLKFLGVDGVEFERRIPRDTYFAILDEAHEDHLPVYALDPIAISPAEASDAGQTTIDNVDSIFEQMLIAQKSEATLAPAIERFLSSGEADKLFATFAKNHTAVTPCRLGIRLVDTSIV